MREVGPTDVLLPKDLKHKLRVLLNPRIGPVFKVLVLCFVLQVQLGSGNSARVALCFRELGRKAREEEEKQRKLLEEGHLIYKDYTKQGQEALKEKQVRIPFISGPCTFEAGQSPGSSFWKR